MSTTLDDRTIISQMHGIQPSRRDASQMHGQSSSGSWKNAPTLIPRPTNPSRASNPYSGPSRFKDNLNQPRGGNLTSSRTVISAAAAAAEYGPPPAKRQRQDQDPWLTAPRSRKKVSTASNASARKPGQSDDTGVIFVTDDYEEDHGQRIDSDELNIIDDSGTSRHFQTGTSTPRYSRPIPDGEATEELRRGRLMLAPEDFDDPIESFDPPTQKQSGLVKKRVKELEKIPQPSAPLKKIDFTKLPAPKTVRGSMKPKNPDNHSLLTPALLNGSHPKSNPPDKPPDKTVFLPIKAWYLGHKLFEEPYHLVWSGAAPSGPARHTEELDVQMLGKSVTYVEPDEHHDLKIFALETFERIRGHKTLGADYSTFFKQGDDHGRGQITIQFNCTASVWSKDIYKTFVEWLKSTRVEKRHMLRGTAAGSMWQAAERSSQLAETRAARLSKTAEGSVPNGDVPPPKKKPSAIPGLPALDGWSPPPAPRVAAIGNTVAPRARQSRGGPNTPIELEPPPRPLPRPTYKGTDSASAVGSELVRRSLRQSLAPQKPSLDPDEVILVYPPGQTGAVNITNGDVTRLAPGEFLNDTLIEFGLKLWLQELEQEDPELAKQIHVFSSFFYKKLNKKNAQEGYESVRKWTSKFDLFEKKYIIIPINENLHWYLAIIYHPEYTLLPPLPSKSPSTRRRTRLEEAENSPEFDQYKGPKGASSRTSPPASNTSSETRGTPAPTETLAGSGSASPASNDQAEEVFKELTFEQSCSIASDDALTIAIPENPEPCLPAEESPNSLFDAMDVDAVESAQLEVGARALEPQPPSASEIVSEIANGDVSLVISERAVSPDVEIMDIDSPVVNVDPTSNDPASLFRDDSPMPDAFSISSAVKAANFYGQSSKAKGKRKAESLLLGTFPVDTFEDDAEDIPFNGQPSTYIFTLDSLGTRHPKVVTVLSQYLKFEAFHKKGIPIEQSSKALGKAALVPHQPNFCDCGIYLLHLAQTFISDPQRYYNLITTRKGNTNSVERQSDWNDERTKSLRETLTQRIEELSIQWKKDRAAKEDLKKKQEEDVIPESSDDDVDIVDTTPAPPPRKERTPKTTGKAMRARG
ncbi:hypothetical protein B0H10DRAFT_2015955 [Mycena sp. CBHHK59/15]|nr:hypothetical protein B0H10DRAFT_2015955 [Mycena sp. CBHHK59/15]